MFCKCFCPGVLKLKQKDIEIEHEGQNIKIFNMEIQKCKNPNCPDGFISKEMWKCITDALGYEPQGMDRFRLSRKIFAAFRD